MLSYSLKELNGLAKKNNFNRDTLEKVLRLVNILKMLNTNDEFRNKYILKGGTAINLCIFDLPRLSVDIDMNFNLECTKNEMIEIRENHRKLINVLVQLDGYTISKQSRFSFTLDSYILKYVNIMGNPDNIKLELNYSNRVQIFEPVNYNIATSIVKGVSVLALNKVELYGSKIAALIGRTTSRDLYDVYEMVSKKMIAENEESNLRKCSIFYLMISNNFKTIDELIEEYKKNIDNMTFHNIRRNLIPMLRVGTYIDLDNVKKVVNEYIDRLFNLSTKELQFINFFIKRKYHPEYLFGKNIAEKIKYHPMAIWKMIPKNNL